MFAEDIWLHHACVPLALPRVIDEHQRGEDPDTGLPVWRQILRDKFKLNGKQIEQRFDQMEVAYFDYLDYLTDAFRNGKIKNHILEQ